MFHSEFSGGLTIICLCSQPDCSSIAETGLQVEACFVGIVLLRWMSLVFGRKIGATTGCFSGE